MITESSILFSLEAMSNSPLTWGRAGSGPELLSLLQLCARSMCCGAGVGEVQAIPLLTAQRVELSITLSTTAKCPANNDGDKRTYLPWGNRKEKAAELQNKVVQRNYLCMQSKRAPSSRPQSVKQSSRHQPPCLPSYEIHPENWQTCSTTTKLS